VDVVNDMADSTTCRTETASRSRTSADGASGGLDPRTLQARITLHDVPLQAV